MRKESLGVCEAMLVIKRTDDRKYIVTRFEEDHTHALVTPSKQQFIRSNRKVTLRAKHTQFTCHKANIGTCQELVSDGLTQPTNVSSSLR